ncbi:uncharacterized protein L203_102491 [Cryptococcus depauperatus CBS 7841]|uniref:Uncharacterized protein n=1 Tax=Cryptococcus depauperatus CBS 7841 TaxID=1295531 RepID=A0A1E3HF62_9TREE|nr:hypothetical protein L203_06540 [Cryptococcus depauperatus CBS 7841]
MPNLQGQELMTDWNPTLGSFSGSLRREKDNIMNRSTGSPYHVEPEPSYYQGQAVLMNSSGSPYQMSHPITEPHLPLHTQPLHRRHPSSPPAQSGFYPNASNEYYLYPDSWQSPRFYGEGSAAQSRLLSPQVHTGSSSGVSSLLTTRVLTRSYKLEANARELSLKRRGKQNANNKVAGTTLRTPKRTRSVETLRSSKRLRKDEAGQAQLITPPSTAVGDIMITSGLNDTMIPIDEAPEILKQVSIRKEDVHTDDEANESVHRPLVITRHHIEGRKLGLLGIARGELEESKSPTESQLSPRTTIIDALDMDDHGKASVARKHVLETEMRWLDRDSEPTTPRMPTSAAQFHTPAAPGPVKIEIGEMEERVDSVIKEQKIARQLQAFSDSSIPPDEPLVCTRIKLFGRVAVSKYTALSFLQLSGAESVVEEIKLGEELWNETDKQSLPSSVRTKTRPMWPDHEAPWAFAGGSTKDKIRREEEKKAYLLRRYLEASSDESEDEDSESIHSYLMASSGPNKHWDKGRGKSVAKLLPNRTCERRARGDDGSARAALLSSLRTRSVPILPTGVVACVCGGSESIGSLITCAVCKTWHHLLCNGIDDLAKMGPNWWCANCNASASGLRTPTQSNATPVRSYSSHGDTRSSAVKSDIDHIALAPSPMFASGKVSNARTPLNRLDRSPHSRRHRRILSYGSDIWTFQDDVAPPSTPAPVVHDRYSTPRINDTPFDVTSTPSRHLDFNIGQPSLFGLTPLNGNGRSRVSSGMLTENTPVLRANPRSVSNTGGPLELIYVPSRADFFRELSKGHAPHSAGPSTHHSHASGLHRQPSSGPNGAGDRENGLSASSPRWTHSLLGAHPLSPSPCSGGHRRSMSANKLSSIRSSSRTGLGIPDLDVNEEMEELEER